MKKGRVKIAPTPFRPVSSRTLFCLGFLFLCLRLAFGFALAFSFSLALGLAFSSFPFCLRLSLLGCFFLYLFLVRLFLHGRTRRRSWGSRRSRFGCRKAETAKGHDYQRHNQCLNAFHLLTSFPRHFAIFVEL